VEFATRIAFVTYKRYFLRGVLHQLSDELHLLVSLAKNILSFDFVHSSGLCLFLHNSDFDYSANPIE